MKFFMNYKDRCNIIKTKIHQELFENPHHTWGDWSVDAMTDYRKGRLQALEAAWEITDGLRRTRSTFKSIFFSKQHIRDCIVSSCMEFLEPNESSQYKKGFTEALASI